MMGRRKANKKTPEEREKAKQEKLEAEERKKTERKKQEQEKWKAKKKSLRAKFAKFELHGTSQGKKWELPPDKWIVEELERFGAYNTGKTWTANLTGSIHPVFHKARWPNMSQERYDAAHQAFLLSSRLLEVAGPYLCSFLPHMGSYAKTSRLPIYDNRTIEEIAKASDTLVEMASSVQWDECDFMMAEYGALGRNHFDPGPLEKGSGDGQDDSLMLATLEAKREGYKYRQIGIAVASQLIDSILAAEKGSDRWLVATFMLADVITHELGHTIYLAQIGQGEVFRVGQDIDNEKGYSFIAWLFDGWVPQTININDDYTRVDTGVYWEKRHRIPTTAPRVVYHYSASLHTIQRLFDQAEWAKYDTSKDSLLIRQELLRPKTPFTIQNTARCGHVIDMDDFAYNYSNKGFTKPPKDSKELGNDAIDNPERMPIDEDWDHGEDTVKPVKNPKQQVPKKESIAKEPKKTNGLSLKPSSPELGSARTTRSKRKAPEFDENELEKVIQKYRGSGTKRSPVLLDDDGPEPEANAKTARKAKGSIKTKPDSTSTAMKANCGSKRPPVLTSLGRKTKGRGQREQDPIATAETKGTDEDLAA